MSYHSSLYTNKEIIELLKRAGLKPSDINLSKIKGSPAKSKDCVQTDGNRIKMYRNFLTTHIYWK